MVSLKCFSFWNFSGYLFEMTTANSRHHLRHTRKWSDPGSTFTDTQQYNTQAQKHLTGKKRVCRGMSAVCMKIYKDINLS